VALLHSATRKLAIQFLFLGAPNNPPGGTRLSGVPPDSPLFSAGLSTSGYTFFMSWTLLDTFLSSLIVFIMSSFEVLLPQCLSPSHFSML
jgi:hypothetical protein